MANLNDWNVAAGSNNSSAPDGWPEGMNYSDVNNTGRENMAVMARYFKDINGSLTTAGTANTYTVTLNAGYAAYFDGMMFSAQVNVTNAGATTLNVNSLGAKAVVNGSGAALVSGDLVAGQVYTFAYDGTDFHVIGALPGTIGGRAVNATTLTASGNATFSGEILGESFLRLQNITSGSNNWYLYTNTDDTFRLNYNGSGDDEFTLDSSGNATFSGDVELTTGMLNVNTSTVNTSVELQVNGDVLIKGNVRVGDGGILGTGQIPAQTGLIVTGATTCAVTFSAASNSAALIYGNAGLLGGTDDLEFSGFNEIFMNLPTSAGTSGSLWNDSGTVKVA